VWARVEGARQGSGSGLDGPRKTADSRQKERRDKSLQNEDKESGSDQINRQQRGDVKRERDRKREEQKQRAIEEKGLAAADLFTWHPDARAGRLRKGTHLMLMRYCARATASGLPVMVMVRSELAPSPRSSQFDMRIMAPLICLLNTINLIMLLLRCNFSFLKITNEI
jgi:hypothetical protein